MASVVVPRKIKEIIERLDRMEALILERTRKNTYSVSSADLDFADHIGKPELLDRKTIKAAPRCHMCGKEGTPVEFCSGPYGGLSVYFRCSSCHLYWGETK